MTENALTTWSVLMPVKVLAQAKSRIAGLAGPRRGELALALACDTVTAVLGCDEAARVIVITDDPVAGAALAALGALVVPDEPRDGLNAALRHGAAHAAAWWPGSGTAALSADLPALRPEQIEQHANCAGNIVHAAAGPHHPRDPDQKQHGRKRDHDSRDAGATPLHEPEHDETHRH